MRARDTLTPEIERDLDAMDAAAAGRRPDGGDPLLAELAALVAESRPAPDPAWAAALDRRAAGGFARAARRPRNRLRLVMAPAAGLAACAVIALVVALGTPGPGANGPGGSTAGTSTAGRDTAGGGAGGGSTAGGAGGGSTPAAPDAAAAPRSSAPSETTTSPVPIPPPTPGGSPSSDRRPVRKVQRSAELTLGARRRDIDTVADGVANVATSLGGFVASSSVASREGGDLALRVPSSRLDDAVVRLSRLAHVRRLLRSSLDITAQSVSAKARVADLLAERRSLRAQLAKAFTLDALDKLRARLHAVDRKLQSARAASRRVENRAAFADLGVTIVPEHSQPAATGGGWSPGDAWHDALRVLEVTAGIALVALAVALPLALVGAPAWLAGRRLSRRRRERALDFA